MQIDTRKLKKLIIKAIPYVAFSYVGNLIGFAYRTAEGNGFQEKLLPFMSNLGVAFARIFPSLHPFDLLFGLVLAGVMRLVLYVKSKNKKKFRQGEEYGSAVWGTQKDIEPYMDLSCPENNVILTKTESLTMGKPSAPKFARNKNILVIGGSGSGKTRFFVKPNLMQMHSSYVVTDPKGTVLVECGKMLERGRLKRNADGKIVYRKDEKGYLIRDEKGKYIPVYEPYKIKVFNTIDFAKSMHYNPFAYISKKNREKDILKFVEVLIKNTSSSQQPSGDDFWVKAEKLLYTAYIALIFASAVLHHFTELISCELHRSVELVIGLLLIVRFGTGELHDLAFQCADTLIHALELFTEFELVNGTCFRSVVGIEDILSFRCKCCLLIAQAVHGRAVQPCHRIGKGFTALLVEVDTEALDRVIESDHTVQLVFDTVTLCRQGVDFLPPLFDLLLTLRNLDLTDSLNTLLIIRYDRADTWQIADSRFQHTVRIFELVRFRTQGFDLCPVAVDLVRLIGDFFINGVDTALMMFRLSVQNRKKFSRLLNAGLVLLLLLRPCLLFAKLLLRIDRRLVGGTLIVIILYGHTLPHFLRFTMMITAAVTAVTMALPMIINFFMVCSSFLILHSVWYAPARYAVCAERSQLSVCGLLL